MTPAVAYLRMSSDKQDTSIPAQRDAIARLAKSGRFKIVREYVDAGISGDDTTRRVEFQRMIADAARGEFKAILCWDQDRFGRFDSLEAGFWILPLRNAGVQLVTVAQGVIDWTDFAGRLLFTVQQEGKHQFLRDLSRNVLRGKLASVAAGKWPSGQPPFGYRVGTDTKLEIVESEAKVVREIFRLYVGGLSWNGVRDELNRRGIPAPKGGRWASNVIGRILANPAYVGTVRFNRRSFSKYARIAAGEIIPKPQAGAVTNDPDDVLTVENAHPAIVSRATWQAADQKRIENRPWSSVDKPRPMVFTGLLKCGFCGYAMHAGWVPAMRDVVYICAQYRSTGGCNPNRVYQGPLTSLVRDAIRDQFLSPKAIRAARQAVVERLGNIPASSVAALQRHLESCRAKLTKAERRLLEVEPDMVKTVSAQIRTLRHDVADAEAELRSASRPRDKLLAEQMAAVDEAISQWQQIVSGDATDDQSLAALLRSSIERIDVKAVKESAKNIPKGRYRVTDLHIIAKSPDKPH